MDDNVKDLRERLVAMDYAFENSDHEFRRRYFLMRMAMQDALKALATVEGSVPFLVREKIQFAAARLRDGMNRSRMPRLKEVMGKPEGK